MAVPTDTLISSNLSVDDGFWGRLFGSMDAWR